MGHVLFTPWNMNELKFVEWKKKKRCFRSIDRDRSKIVHDDKVKVRKFNGIVAAVVVIGICYLAMIRRSYSLFSHD